MGAPNILVQYMQSFTVGLATESTLKVPYPGRNFIAMPNNIISIPNNCRTIAFNSARSCGFFDAFDSVKSVDTTEKVKKQAEVAATINKKIFTLSSSVDPS
jgi:hypothetical protein